MTSDTPRLSPPDTSYRTIRPIGVVSVYGICFDGDQLYAIDKNRGFVLKINPLTDDTSVINPYQTDEFIDVTSLVISQDSLWLTRDNSVYFCPVLSKQLAISQLDPQHFVTLPYQADGLAVSDSTIYVSCQKAGKIMVFNRRTGQEITKFYAPGMGFENLTLRGEELWVSDQQEQTIYCLDRATGHVKFSLLTPFESPTGLAFHRHPETGVEQLYVAYAGEELYIRDDPNSAEPYRLSRRDRTFIHPLSFHYHEQEKYAISNGFLVEMSYVEELEPLDEVYLDDLEWRIALPSNTIRQKVREISAVGMNFTEIEENGERIAVFRFKPLHQRERRIFGWRAILEVYSIKYHLQPYDCEKIPELSAEMQQKYLKDDDNLAMATDTIKEAALLAVARETNIIRKLLSIRNYVYDCLSYKVTAQIDPPDVVLKRGTGSCGEYVGLLLALARLNGIACRTIGRYKCPAFPDHQNLPLEPEFNHVWLEFYIPGFGWVPMESNPDDIQEGGPYPLRFFMGLAWYHIEIGKGVKFQSLTDQGLPLDKEKISIGNLAINHVRFKILEELF